MSVIFGIRSPFGSSVTTSELEVLAQATMPYALEGSILRAAGRIGMGFQPNHSYRRSRLEFTIASDASGNMVVLDGRLDNYQELSHELHLDNSTTADSQLVIASFQRWGEACFSRLLGDWAVAFWHEESQTLYLGRDHAGTRTLYFAAMGSTLLWSTYLDTFFVEGRTIEPDEIFAASYLALLPVRDLTPYKGIRAVLPAHFVRIRETEASQTAHWRWMRNEVTRYNSDKEYEEHYLSLFEKAVARRDDGDGSILADLSGGVDSSSNVCMSDRLRKLSGQTGDLIDTVSFYDDQESSWNEMPYVSVVETHRGKSGIHIPHSFTEYTFDPPNSSLGKYWGPGPDSSTVEQEIRFERAIEGKRYLARLSGFGGDEVSGGVPTPDPELAEYLVHANISRLFHRTLQWCLIDRTPLLHSLLHTISYTIDLYNLRSTGRNALPPWISPTIRKRCADLLGHDVLSTSRSDTSPTSIANGEMWWHMLETLPHLHPGALSRPEYRYPHLDRELVEFLFSVPREQLVRPGQRRSLMRRALRDVVPSKVLERRRKAYRIRGPMAVLQQHEKKLLQLLDNALVVERGLVDRQKLQLALRLTSSGQSMVWWQALMRTVAYELWLRGVTSDDFRTFTAQDRLSALA